MVETIKTIRLLHQIIIALSAALLTFAISPDEVPTLDAALDELRFLRDMEQRDYYAWLAHEKDVKSGRLIEDSQFLAQGLRGTLAADFTFQPAFYAEWPGTEASLRSWELFFTSGSLVEVYRTRMQEFDTNIKAVPSHVITERAHLVATVQQLTLTRANCVVPLGERWRSEVDRGEDVYLFQRVTRTRFKLGQMDLQVHYRGANDGQGGVMVGPLPLDSSPQIGDHGARWLASAPQLEQRLGGAKTHFIPHAHRYWMEIESLRIAEAISTLTKKRLAAPRTLTLWSLTVESSLLVWLGPLVSLLIVAYLVVHLLHLTRFGARDGKHIRDFPWVGLFDDWLSVIWLSVTLFALPLAANVAVLWRSFEGGRRESYVGLLFLVMLSVALIRLWLLRMELCRRFVRRGLV